MTTVQKPQQQKACQKLEKEEEEEEKEECWAASNHKSSSKEKKRRNSSMDSLPEDRAPSRPVAVADPGKPGWMVHSSLSLVYYSGFLHYFGVG